MSKDLHYYLSLDYPVEIRRISEDLGGGYSASIPSLGVYAFVGDGETPEEAYVNLQEAKAELFADLLDEGRDIPEPPADDGLQAYSGKLVLRMPRELHASLATRAERNGVSLNAYINHLLSGAREDRPSARETSEATRQAEGHRLLATLVSRRLSQSLSAATWDYPGRLEPLQMRGALLREYFTMFRAMQPEERDEDSTELKVVEYEPAA